MATPTEIAASQQAVTSLAALLTQNGHTAGQIGELVGVPDATVKLAGLEHTIAALREELEAVDAELAEWRQLGAELDNIVGKIPPRHDA